MATTVAKPKAPKAPKEKKAAVAKKLRTHPPYSDMVKEAIATLKERTGSSQYAITKYIEDNQKELSPLFKKHISLQLRRLVASGALTKIKSSYKLSVPVKAIPVKKVEGVKKKAAVVAKPKKAAVAVKPKKAGGSATKKKSVVKPKAKAVEKATPVKKAVKKATPVKKAVKKATPVKKAVKKVKSLKSPVKKGKK
ncbi:H15 domain-containing protein [Heracleum sosnowskyi]|uniref:H15 domain-containing protein n=1 Tax=Heracleum sosnowskyi TaxID=360622 RepID=A0AAD8J2T8_9APIA|nr:H15 domain-containing protein [Heracleum sosnowskyi]